MLQAAGDTAEYKVDYMQDLQNARPDTSCNNMMRDHDSSTRCKLLLTVKSGTGATRRTCKVCGQKCIVTT